MPSHRCRLGPLSQVCSDWPVPGILWLWQMSGQVRLQVGELTCTLPAGRMVLLAHTHPGRCEIIQAQGQSLCYSGPLLAAFDLKLPPVWRETLFCQGLICMQGDESPERIQRCAERWQEELECLADDERQLVLDDISVILRRALLSGGQTGTPPVLKPASRRQARRVMRMLEFMACHFREPLDADTVARAAGLHKCTAMTHFRKTVGLSMTQYLSLLRAYEARRLLEVTQIPVSEIAYSSGFASLTRFYEVFGRTFGMRPQQVRQTRTPA